MIDYNWRSPSQRIEMSNQYGWKPRQATNPGISLGGPTLSLNPIGGQYLFPGQPPSIHPPPTIPGGTPGYVPPGSGYNPWQDSGVGSGGNSPLDYTVPTDSHNIVQIPGLPPVMNPAVTNQEGGGNQTGEIAGYAQGGVIPPGLEQYRKLLRGNWRPKKLVPIADPNALTGVDTGAIAKRT